MRAGFLRRFEASVLLALLLCGPIGPVGAYHVAQADPGLPRTTAVSAVADLTTAHGPACAICHFLTSLRVTPAASPATVAPLLAAVAQFPASDGQAIHDWLASPSAGRGPPLA